MAAEQGIVDVLGSDHAPHTREEKTKAYPATPSGMTGVETLVPIMLDHVNAGRLSLLRFVDLAGAGPAPLFGIPAKAVSRWATTPISRSSTEAAAEPVTDADQVARRLDAL